MTVLTEPLSRSAGFLTKGVLQAGLPNANPGFEADKPGSASVDERLEALGYR